MKLARRDIDDPERIRDLEASFDDKVSGLLAEAKDAGYGTDEAAKAPLKVMQNQAAIAEEDHPDPGAIPSKMSTEGPANSFVWAAVGFLGRPMLRSS